MVDLRDGEVILYTQVRVVITMASSPYIKKRILGYLQRVRPARFTSADLAKELNFTPGEVGAILKTMSDLVIPIGRTPGRYNKKQEYEIIRRLL